MVGYIFGGDTGKSYADLKREREIADMLAAQALQGQRTGLPGAIEQIGKALIAKKKGAKVSAGEEAARNEARDAMMRLLGGGSSVPSVNYTLAGSNRDMAAKPDPTGYGQPGQAFAGDLGDPTFTQAEDVMRQYGVVANDADPGMGYDQTGKAVAMSEAGNLGTAGLAMSPEVRAGIFAGESNGDYDALFGFSHRAGKNFEGVKLTEMTVDQALDFANPSGQYGQWVKGQVGHVATPMGAYQVVGTTLRAAKEGLGLRGDEKMTPELQDRIGDWIYRNQGTQAWEGYRGPTDPNSISPSAGGVGGGYRVAHAGGMGSMTDALAILDNPYASDAQRMIAGQIIQQRFAKPDGLTAWQAAQLDMKRQEMEMRRQGTWSAGNNVNVNMPGAPEIGTIPQGYEVFIGPDGNRQMRAIPGGPKDTTENEAAARKNEVQTANIMSEDVGRALKIIEEEGQWAAGMGSMLRGIPGTKAKTLDGLLETVKGLVAMDTLQGMREASPTGGALGAVSAPELRMLQSAMGNLEQSQNPEELARNLRRVNAIYMAIIHEGPEAAAAAFNSSGAKRLRFNPETGELE